MKALFRLIFGYAQRRRDAESEGRMKECTMQEAQRTMNGQGTGASPRSLLEQLGHLGRWFAVAAAGVVLLGGWAQEAEADPWICPFSENTGDLGDYAVGDSMPTYWLCYWCNGDAQGATKKVGIGWLSSASDTDFSDWSWENASQTDAWDNDGNRKYYRNIEDFQFTKAGKYYVIYQAGSVSRTTAEWSGDTSWPPADMGGTYIDVIALNAPSGITATPQGKTSIKLDWTKGTTAGSAKNTLIVRNTTGTPPTITSPWNYYVGQDPTGGTTIYKDSGTTFTDTGLTEGTTYYYFFYAENYEYHSAYSAAATASATTYGVVSKTDSTVTIGGAGNGYRVWAGKQDVITKSVIFPDSAPTAYTVWSDKSVTGGSGAVYAGRGRTVSSGAGFSVSRGTSTSSYGGLWTTTSGGIARRIIVDWEASSQVTTTNSTNSRNVDVWGQEAASSTYTASTFQKNPPAGTWLLRMIQALHAANVDVPNVEVVISGTYRNLGIGGQLAERAVYLESLTIEWEKAGSTTTSASWGTGVELTGLSPSTTYTWGVANGTNLIASGMFTTEAAAAVAPTVTTGDATSIGTTSATMAGTLTADGGEAPDYAGIALGTASGVYANNYNSTTAPTTANPGISVTRSDLTANTLYYYKAYAHNSAGTGWASTEGSFRTTANKPGTAPSVSVEHASSYKTSRLHITAEKASGSMGTLIMIYTASSMTGPSDRTGYTANVAWGSAEQINSQGRVVYMGTDAAPAINVTGLSAGTTYYVRAYAYNGTANATAVLNSLAYSSTYGSGSMSTLADAPTGAPSLSVTDKTQTTITLSVTKGAGATDTLIIAREANAPSGNPTNGEGYDADTEYGEGDPLRDGYVVMSGSGTSVEVTGLEAGTRYYFWAFAYNGSGYSANYYTTSKGTLNDSTLATAPSTQATAALAGTGTTTATITYTRPSPGSDGVVLVMKAGSAPTWTPTPGSKDITASATFGSGTQVATGEYVVYDGNGGAGASASTRDITGGLAPGTHYYVRAYAYAGGAGAYAYNTTTEGTVDDTWTLSAEPTATASVTGAATGSETAEITYDTDTGSGSEGAGYVLVVVMPYAGAAAPTVTDGQVYDNSGSYGAGAHLGNGYAVYAGPATSGAGGKVTVSGLASGTQYTVYLFPYNMVSGEPTTANYKAGVQMSTPAAYFETDRATGPTGLSATSGRNWITATWTGIEGATYNLQITACGGSEAWSTVTDGTCPDSDLSRVPEATGSAWVYIQPGSETEGWPLWGTDSADSQAGHTLKTTKGSPSPKPAVCSPTLDLRNYTEGKVEFKHWSRHKGTDYYATQSRVTLYYRTSLNGSTWGAWTPGDTTADLTDTTKSYANGPVESMDIPSAALGKRYVQIKLSADEAKTYTGGINTGPKLKGIVVKARATGGDYESCATYLKTDVTGVSAETYTFTGLPSAQRYFYRVQAVVGGIASAWSEGVAETTVFEGPTGVAVTGTTRYTLTAEWNKCTEAGYTTEYNVKLSQCGGAVSGTVSDGTCPDEALGTSASASAWWYRMSRNSGGAGSYPAYMGGGHALRAAQSGITEFPGVASPMLDMSGYTGGKISFNVWSYLNDDRYFETHTKVYLHWRVKTGGSWGSWSEKSDAYSAAAATTGTAPGNAREIALPAASLVENVQYMLCADDSRVVDLGASYDPRYVNPGPVLKGIAIEGESSGSGDFATEGCVVESHDGVNSHDSSATGTASYTFGLAANGAEALEPGKTYYVQVETVLTKTGDTATSRGSEAKGTTLTAMAPPAEIWGQDIKQKHMTVAWTAAEGADSDTRYKLQVTGCSAGTATETPVREASTAGRLTEEDDWVYIGGGTPTGAETVTLENGQTKTKETEVGSNGIATTGGATYPAFAGNANDQSHVLAGYGEPGIETLEFSTVGATAGQVTFKHGRWYDGTAALCTHASLELSYSTDGGASWTAFASKAGSTVQSADHPTVDQSSALPAGALGQPRVKVRIVATNATIANTATSGTAKYHALGAQVRAAKVTLTKTKGDYSSCATYAPQTFEELTHEQLEQALGGDALRPALAADTVYYFRVAASDGKRTLAGGGYAYGAWTDGTAKTLAVPGKAGMPWAVDIGRHVMTLRWDDVAGAESYDLKVYNNADCAAGHEVAGTGWTGLTITEQKVTGLAANTWYWFRVRAVADGETGDWSDIGSTAPKGKAQTTTSLAVTGLHAEDILDTSMTLKWDDIPGATEIKLTWGEADAENATPLDEEIKCPASTLKRSDAGNGWFYFGGDASHPVYWTSPVNPAEDHGHVLNQTAGGAPGIQSRWFSTFDAKSATVDFWHGRYGAGSDSTVLVQYSVDGGATWGTAGTAPSTAATTPSEHRQIDLPADALGKRSVMVKLTATGASGSKGAEIKDLKLVVRSGEGTTKGSDINVTSAGGSYALGTGGTPLQAGKRYWFQLTAKEGGDTAALSATATTRTRTTGALKSQGFEGTDAGSAGHYTHGALDASGKAWGYTVKYITADSAGSDASGRTAGTARPVVEVVDGENPLYGDRAIRMSGSTRADVYGVVEFDDYNPGGANSWVVTIPFAAYGLAEGENLWVSYSTDNGSTWVAPANATATLPKGGMTLGKIARGGNAAATQNWPYNAGTESSMRPLGDAYVFEVENVERIAVRVAFCGNENGEKRYVYVDEVTLTPKPGMPTGVSATALDNGKVGLTWTPPAGQGVVILRGQDERHVPASPVDVNNLPHGYEIVMNGSSPYWPNGTSYVPANPYQDGQVQSGWKYFYYFYGAIDNGDGTYTLGTTPARADAVVKGMVNAIASQGWDGWDVHPWNYRKGRVTNPGRSGDYGWWKRHGMNGVNVAFIGREENEGEISWETDATKDSPSRPGSSITFAGLYGPGGTYPGAAGDDCTEQLGVTSSRQYYGAHSFRLSGGGSFYWHESSAWTYTDYNDNEIETNNVYINTNNAAIEFANVDLSGYKNVEFQMHYAGINLNGGNDLHVAISTNGGAAGSWLEVGNNNAAGWKEYPSNYDYGRAISDGDTASGGNWDFYFEDAKKTPYGNPYVLRVPDNVTQFMVRVMFYDSNGGQKKNASYFIDEVRLLGEVAIETPKPVMTDIAKDAFTVTWENVPGASGYNLRVSSREKPDTVKLQESFVLNVLTNGWTGKTVNNAASGWELSSAANRLGTGYGLGLTGEGGWVSSPLTGAANKIAFHACRTAGARAGDQMEVQARAEGETTWVTVGTLDAGDVPTSYSGTAYEFDLPRRQWQEVRFVQTTTSSGKWHIDDVTIYGGGDYSTTYLVKAVSQAAAGDAETVQTRTFKNGIDGVVLGAASEYFVEVQAYGSPAGYLAYSSWGETADYTTGDFTAAADGFEMTRLAWDASSSVPILVVAVTNGTYADVPTPSGTYSAGDQIVAGKAVVVDQAVAAATTPKREFVWPYKGDGEPAQFVAFWKHGSFWEGRLQTNVELGIYVCQAADAMAITNATAVPAGTQGKGWAAGWKPWDDDDAKASPDYISVLQSSTTESGYTYYGLVGSNKLAGAGGNAIRFTMGDGSALRLARALSAPVDEGEVWIMFQVRSQYGGDSDDKMFGMQLSTGTDATTAGGGIFASIGNMKYRYGDGDARAPRLQIDTSVDASWPGGSGINWDEAATGYTPYELKDTGNQGSGTHTVVIKYDVDAKKIYAAGIYTTSAETIANNGPLAPNSAPPAFHCEATLSSKKTLGTIILLGKGNNGSLDFDEVRVGGSWQDIVGKETEAPFPVTGATAWADGNELVRISWTYADAGRDTTAGVDRPLADGVKIFAKEGDGGWAEIYKGKGTNATVAAGEASRWDHVVAPGSTHQYKVEAYASAKTAPAVNAQLRGSDPALYSVTTGSYGSGEYVNPFSYTNWTVASTAEGRRWIGGNGFGENYWAPGSGSAGTWSIATPEEAREAVHITNAVTGARLAAGNVLKAVVGDGETASIDRTLDGDAWYGKAGQTFYVAFRMAYQWGDNGGRQAGLRLTDDSGKYVQFGKARGDDEGYKHRFGVTASPNGTGYTSGWSTSGDDMNGYGNASGAAYVNNAYLVVAKVNWSADGKANLRGVKYLIGNDGTPAELPSEESGVSWEASYDNAGIGAIRKIELIAGTANSGYGTIGTAWFDEIRFGPTWEDIVGAKEPRDAWVEGLEEVVGGVKTATDPVTHYLGDTTRWYMWGWEKGPKQSAWVTLAADAAFETVLATADTDWVENAADGRGGQQTKWQGKEIQFTQPGTLYGGGSVKGELVTINSWTRTGADNHKRNVYTVNALPKPTKPEPANADDPPTATGGAAMVTLSWAPATVGGRTFSEVMVVRFAGDATPAWRPTQGTTYMKGDKVASNAGEVLYRGTAETSLLDKGLAVEATAYTYQFYTVNNSYYSDPSTATGSTTGGSPAIEVDGDPIDWVGVPSDTKNSATVSSSEYIWTDKSGDGRTDTAKARNADITEFRIKVDENNVYFLARLKQMTDAAHPHIAVGVTTNVDATKLAATGNGDGEDWLGDEADTYMGGNLFSPTDLHHADVQFAVHQVGGTWKIELHRKGQDEWYDPSDGWEAAASTENACIEWKIKRSDLGLERKSVVTPYRFTVASFANTSGSNKGSSRGTEEVSPGKSYAVDTLAIAPWDADDKDLSLTAWEEGIQEKKAEYWFDLWFDGTGSSSPTVYNNPPARPAHCWLNTDTAHRDTQDLVVPASPTMHWTPSEDQTIPGGKKGFVAGYFLEVSTNEFFNGLEGTTENGPVSLRKNLKASDVTTYEATADTAVASGKTYYALVDGEYIPQTPEGGDNPASQGWYEATMCSYRYVTDSRHYWWRVRARDNSGALSAWTKWHYTVEGKTDNEGPKAKLLYVGTQVSDYVNNTVNESWPEGYRTEQDLSGDGTSVLDSDLEDGGHNFGFVIEWYDVNGVYATNHLRGWQAGDGEGSWPAQGDNPYGSWTRGEPPYAGDFAWNILADHDDGTPYGRVSPNWDLVIVDNSVVTTEAEEFTAVSSPSGNPNEKDYYEKSTDTRYVPTGDTEAASGKSYYTMQGGRYRTVAVEEGANPNPAELGWCEARESATYKHSTDTSCAGGKTYYTRTSAEPMDELVGGEHHYYQWVQNYTLPKEPEGSEVVDRWIIDCGKDAVFQPNQTICDGNSGQYVTNYVTGAFSIGNYRPTLDIYLTVSAEDGCTTGEFGPTADWDWPIKSSTGSTGSWAGRKGTSGDNAVTASVSGWCADRPNPSRNVRVNQLLKIRVRDNDITPPVTSKAKWGADAEDASGEKIHPMVAVARGTSTASGANSETAEDSRPGAWDPTWANLDADGLTRLPTYEGQGRTLQWHLTDADVAGYTPPAGPGETGTTTWKGAASPLNFFFNVYDLYVHSGLKYDTGDPLGNASNWVSKTVGGQTVSRGLFNTGFLLKSWDSEGNSGAGAWVPGTNWAQFNRGRSSILREDNNVAHGKGTDPATVLAWTLDASEANVEALLERKNVLSAIGIDPETGEGLVVSNSLKLHAWDADNNSWGDQVGAELEFGQLLFSDDDATPPEMPGFAAYGTGTNYTHFGELAKWTWGSGKDDVTRTVKMGAIRMSDNVDGKQSGTSSTPESDTGETVRWNSGKSAIYLQGNMNATAYRATNAKYFQFQMGGDGTTTWRTDMIGFWSRVSPTGPTKFTLTVQGTAGTAYPALSGSTTWYTPVGSSEPLWTPGENCTAIGSAGSGSHYTSHVIDFVPTSTSGTTVDLTGPEISCASYSTMMVDYIVGRSGGKQSAPALAVQYHLDTWAADRWETAISYPHNKSEWTTTLQGEEAGADTGHSEGGWDLFEIVERNEGISLARSSHKVAVRFHATGIYQTSGGTKYGFRVVDPKVTGGGDSSAERWLGDIVIEKNIATETVTTAGEEQTAGSYANTETSVVLGFDGLVEGHDASLQTFRLYGYGATHMDANTGAVGTDNTSQGTWAIKDLYIHGTASEVTPYLVTDFDITQGTWTNRLEAVDGAMAGYDTARSGLRLFDATNAAGEKTECSGEVPAFRILYPTYIDGTTGASATVAGGELVLDAAAHATYAAIDDPDFDSAAGWTLLNEAAIANGVLTLPGNGEVSSASRSFGVSPPLDLESVTIAGTVSAKGTVGGVNTLTVTVQPCSDNAGAAAIGDPLTEDITTTSRPKNFALGPWPLDLTTVRSVRVTVAQAGTETTAMAVDGLNVYVAQWGPEISAEKASDAAAWAENVTNGIPGAKLVVGTPPVDLSSVSVPIYPESQIGTLNRHYRLEATLHDYDKDRAGDALSASAITNFWLYDDDITVPQFGSKYGGPLGVFLNGTIVPQGWRTGITAGNENSKLNQRWPVTDAELTKLQHDDPVTFALSFYDFSGWTVTNLVLGETSLVSGGALAAAAETAGWTAPAENDGAADSPGATSTWSIGAKDLYTAYRGAFEGSSGGAVLDMKAEIWDKDRDRADDALSFNEGGGPKKVGEVWFTDQDVLPPAWGTQIQNYRGVMIATNVPADGFAALTNTVPPDGESELAVLRYALLRNGSGTAATLADHQTATPGTRSFALYDGELHDVDGSHKLVVLADLNDPQESYSGRKLSGLQRGATLTETRTLWGESFPVTNSHVVFEAEDGTCLFTNAAFNADFSVPVSRTRVAMQAGHTGWTWDGFTTNDIGKLLPSGQSSALLRLAVWAYDSDSNRPCDQAGGRLEGPQIRLRDDDTTPPEAPGAAVLFKDGTALPVPETLSKETVPWVNTLEGLSVHFTEAEDGDGTGTAGADGFRDLNVSGIAGYRFASPEAAVAADAGAPLSLGIDADDAGVAKKTASLAGIAVEQGWGSYKLFAVDRDDDRDGDALAGAAATVALGYDRTRPTDAASLEASDDVDDQTSMMKLTWEGPADGMGPDNLAAGNRFRYSPWDSYKVYYTTYTPDPALGPEADPMEDDDNVANKIAGGPSTWDCITAASKEAYGALADPETTTFVLEDLDPGENYIFAIVGLDKAGNESQHPRYAVGDTIKFMVTQSVIRAWSDVAELTANFGAEVFSPDNTEGTRGTPALYWKATMFTNKNEKIQASRGYSLIYRDDETFREGADVAWTKAGNSISNNYYAEPDGSAMKLERGRMRYYRATYEGREPWVQGKIPLASEEVYALHQVKLSEGRNLVTLHGLPYTNTFRGVFGTDTNYWPAGDSPATATRVEFFTSAAEHAMYQTNFAAGSEVYYLSRDGKWLDANESDPEKADVTADLQAEGFFTRPFSLTIPTNAADTFFNTDKVMARRMDEASGALAYEEVRVFDWSPILMVPTNNAGFTATVSCGSFTVKGIGPVSIRTPHYRITPVAFVSPVAAHPDDLGLPLVSSSESGAKGFTYNEASPAVSDKISLMVPARKRARFVGETSALGTDDTGISLDAASDMYFDHTTTNWRWYRGDINANNPVVTGKPIKPNDVILIKSCNGDSGSWTWTYSPTNLYQGLPDRHMGR